MKVPVNKGINRWRWGLWMSYSADEIETYRSKQQSVINELQGIVKDKTLKKLLKEIQSDWEDSNSQRSLNNIRSQLVANFNMYANRRDFFGEKMMPRLSADPGVYNLTVEVAGQKFEQVIEVRADPLMD